MLTSLDLLVLIFMGLSAMGLLAMCLMFLIKKDIVKKVCFYLLAFEGMAVSVMNALTLPVGYMGEMALGWGLGALSIAAIILTICGKSEKKFLIARIMVMVSVIAGILNTFVC